MASGGNPIDGFAVAARDLSYIGQELQRPECILAERDGSLWTADARGGVVHIRPDGSQQLITQQVAEGFTSVEPEEASRFVVGTLPNGLAFARNGDILIANFGTDRLEVMTRRGETRVLIDEIDGQPIGKVNFVLRDSKDRIWLTISTRIKDWMRAISPNVADGYVAVYDGQRLRIVADGFKFTNEIRFDAKEEWLYVVETCGPCITRLRIDENAQAVERETFGPQHHGALIDGIAFDAYGNLWGTHIFSDHVFAITPQGDLRIILDDDHDSVASRTLMEAFARDAVTPDLIMATGGQTGPWLTSITFGGADLRTLYVGNLKGTRIGYFRAPVAGLPMVHW